MAETLGNIKVVMSLASSILKIGENYYHASSALEDFKANVARLESTYELWQSRGQKDGILKERTLLLSFKEAEKQLHREEARLKDLDRGCGCRCFWLSSGTDFPAQLGKSIVDLNTMILSDWKANSDDEDKAQKIAEDLAKALKFGFYRDPRYVKVPVVERELKNVLNNEDSGEGNIRVVLLYGRAGSGKSSMARNLALDYKQAATSAVDGCSSNSAHWCREFDDVFYVECGPEAKSDATQKDLLGMLGWKRASKTEEDPVEDKHILEQLLKERRSLIIFDDVWEGEFLKDMVVVCGKDMRILVTSQRKGLCEDYLIEKTKPVPMNEIVAEDSIRILKVHTGFNEEELVPKAVKKCMDILVAKVSGHPHALASIAVAIDATRKTETEQWEAAIFEYDQFLEEPLSEKVMNPIHDVPYERSVIEAIRVKFRLLREEERILLVLMAMLKGPSVPEELLQLFYGDMIFQNGPAGLTSQRSFSYVRKRLEDLQFIKFSKYRAAQRSFSIGRIEQRRERWQGVEIEGISWSIHPLDEQFIQMRMDSDIHGILEVVKNLPNKVQGLVTEPQVNVVKILGFLFFKSPWYRAIEKTFVKYPHSLPWCSAIDGYGHVLFLISLMTKNVGNEWTSYSRRSAYQMFLSSIVDRIFHNNAAEELWSSSVSKHKLWTFMRWWNWKAVGWSISEDIIHGVLRSFGDVHLPWDTSVILSLNPDQWSALLVLVSRPHICPARHRVFGMRDLVLGLIDTLKSSSCPRHIKHSSAVVLSYLLPLMHDRISEYGEEGLASTPLVKEELLQSLQEHTDREVRESAMFACSFLAESPIYDVNGKMINCWDSSSFCTF